VPSACQPAESAKQFLISKVLRQADSDGVLLSDLEKRMGKIARLLLRAYQQDSKLGQKRRWEDAVRALRSEDWYILVMLQQAGIKPAVGWHITMLCLCAGVETLVALSYARGIIDFRWAVIGLAVFGFGIVRQVTMIKHRDIRNDLE
jgi:hypothetical protein